MKSKITGEQATPEHPILPRGAYQLSLGNKYHPLRANEHERERENRLTTSCVDGRSEDEREATQEAEEDEYDYVLCKDAGRQFANRPYFERVRKRKHGLGGRSTLVAGSASAQELSTQSTSET